MREETRIFCDTPTILFKYFDCSLTRYSKAVRKQNNRLDLTLKVYNTQNADFKWN